MRRNMLNHEGHRIELSSRPNEQTNDVGAVKKMSKAGARRDAKGTYEVARGRLEGEERREVRSSPRRCPRCVLQESQREEELTFTRNRQ